MSYYAPASFAELCSTSDLVARVRIDRSSVKALALSGLEKKNPKTVLTEFIVTVQDVIFSKTAAPAGPIRIFQHAGEADVDGRKIKVADESFPALQGSSSYILFLRWRPDLQGYEISYGPHGTYAIKGNKVDTPGQSAVAAAFRDQPLDTLMNRIRSCAK